jgi:sigma-B regulation protein RsbU (phosphoserine phosphatase)
MNIPIEIGGNVIGAFSLSSHSKQLCLSSEDIEAIKRFVKQISVVLRNAKLYEEIRQKKEELELKDKLIREDLYLAKKIQNNVISKDYLNIEQLKINIYFQPMIEVGGDIYDIFELKKNYYRIFIADATGHGVQAALTTMIIKGEYDKIKIFDIPSNQLLKIFNNSFYNSYENLNVFFTCVVFDIDLENNKIYYSSAGHPKQYLISKNKLIKLETGGTLLGVIKKINYRNNVVSFNKGDILYLLSDGLFEEFNEIGLELGEKRIADCFGKNKHLSMEKFMGNIMKFVKNWVGNSGVSDDITFIGIEYL